MTRSTYIFLLTAALSLGATAQTQQKGAATALELNPHGVGHLLVVPYFSTQGGNATLLNVINASDTVKAVKVRFLGAGNGDELFSLQVFLRARDAWTVNISSGADGLPVLTTNDSSCTLPTTVSGRKFSTARLNPALTGDALANHAREGYIEIIAMGDVIQGTALRTAVTHVSGVPPCTFSVFNALERFDAQLAPPTTGLTANWILINVPQTTTWFGEATAFEARLNGAPSTGNVVFFPQTDAALTGPDVASYTSDPLYNFAFAGVIAGPIVPPISSNLPDLSTPYSATAASPQGQATELSARISAKEIVVEYLSDPAIQASTDWVLSMPTKRYHAAVDYRVPRSIKNRFAFEDLTAFYFRDGSLGGPLAGMLCVMGNTQQRLKAFDREGASSSFSLFGAAEIRICGPVAVLSVRGEPAGPSDTLRASVTRAQLVDPIFQSANGSAYLTFGYDGPVLVRQFSRAVNPQAAPGVSGTYGATWAGRMTIPGLLPQ